MLLLYVCHMIKMAFYTKKLNDKFNDMHVLSTNTIFKLIDYKF